MSATWLLIPFGERFASWNIRKALPISIMLAVVCIGWFFYFYSSLIYRLALRSVVAGTPLDRSYAVGILNLRVNAAGDAELWRFVEVIDWKSPPFYHDRWDYRDACIQHLIQHDPANAAERLSMILRKHPSSSLASCAAPILAQNRRYETAPELFRFGLFGFLHKNNCYEAETALQTMNVPQAGLLMIYHAAGIKAIVTGVPVKASTWIDKGIEDDLAKILGKDIGPRWGDWAALYDDKIQQLPTPLSADEASQLDRIYGAYSNYVPIWIRVRHSTVASSIPLPDMNVPGTDAFELQIKNYIAAVDQAFANDRIRRQALTKPGAP